MKSTKINTSCNRNLEIEFSEADFLEWVKSQKLPDDDYFKSYQRTDADIDRMRGFINEALKLGTMRFQFTGNGEVFLYENILIMF